MARIRLNQEYRNKCANRLRVHLEQEDTQEKRKYDDLKGDQIDLNDNAWKIAEKIVRRHYTLDDVAKARYLLLLSTYFVLCGLLSLPSCSIKISGLQLSCAFNSSRNKA